jgi:hypothetical protein
VREGRRASSTVVYRTYSQPSFWDIALFSLVGTIVEFAVIKVIAHAYSMNFDDDQKLDDDKEAAPSEELLEELMEEENEGEALADIAGDSEEKAWE